MQTSSKNVFILALGQALTSTSTALLTAVSSLAGLLLAPSPALSTLPVSATVFGALLMIYPASALMQRFGRRAGFMFKSGLGITGGVIAVFGMTGHSFILLTAGAFILGLFSAFGQYYRFAALDAAHSREQKHRAIAVVTGAGVIGGIAGPFLAAHFPDIVPGAVYSGAFTALTLVCICLAASQLFLSADLGKDTALTPQQAAAESAVIQWPLFIRSSALCAIAFAVMTLMMNSAPLSMHHHDYSLQDSSTALQFHFAFMFLPSFLNPWLIQRTGIAGLIRTGIIINMAGCLLALIPAQSMLLYTTELALSGIGWNFIFNGGTLLLMESYPLKLKARAQGLNSFIVYLANMIASLFAGILMATLNWHYVNFICLPLLFIAAYLIYHYRSPAENYL